MASPSSGSATGNPRNKVALKPGHSLMDWIRLGNSGEDLSGTKGSIIDVSPAELAKHNKDYDGWLAIRGKVYNVTRYLEFHPGGEEELLKGIGKDATTLFNQVHPWVNYESLLKKCLVGRLVVAVDEDIFSIPSKQIKNSEKSQLAGALGSIAKLGNSIVPPSEVNMSSDYMKTDWYQQKDSATFVLYHKQPHSAEVIVDGRIDGELWVCIGSSGWVGWSIEPTNWPPIVNNFETKTEIRLSKVTNAQWANASTLSNSNPPAEPFKAKIFSSSKVTHNVYLVQLKFIGRLYYFVPLGYHVLITANIKGVSAERNYTPIESLVGNSRLESCSLWLLVKCYPDGLASPWLTKPRGGSVTSNAGNVSNDNVVSISAPVGTFKTPDFVPATLLLLAAGTGLTPMIRLINFTLKKNPKTKIKLVFFNKTEKDIIWKKEFNDLAVDNISFSVEHVLSEASSDWTGLRGWITLQLVQSFLPDFTPDHPHEYYTCVCGPISFTQLTERYLRDLGYPSQNYFCFRG